MRRNLIGASLLAIVVGQASAVHAWGQTAPVNKNGVEEIVVTATKRSEKLQKVPIAIQVLDSKKLDRLNITEFSDYAKYIPSLSFQSEGPNFTTLYLRGVSDGGNANHSGPLPTVGSYFDEIPITTIGGTLDVHVYDMARIEVLPGPQGTLYGASSEAGTVRMITNKPVLDKYEAGYNVEVNELKTGSTGGVAEGFVNIPLGEKAAIRIVGFDEHDGGYIDNVLASRTFTDTGTSISNRAYTERNENPSDTFGGRAALRVDLSEDWSVLEQVIAQDHRDRGNFGYEPSVGDLKVENFGPDYSHDRFVQVANTVTGHVGDFALTYSGGYFVRDVVTRTDYTDYSVFYEQAYPGIGYLWQDKNGNPLANPSQSINGRDRFTKYSNEIRLVSPADDRLRFIFGLFQEQQTHRIIQDYVINGFGPQISIPGWVNTIWLTDQQRTDRDLAAFAEATLDITSKVSLSVGFRPYYYNNTLKGFFGYSEAFDQLQYAPSQPVFTEPGEGADGSNCKPHQYFRGAPCVDLNKAATGEGETHKVNLTYKVTPDALVYFTYSTGYRPGGVNRNGDFGAYQADFLTNYELGFKTSWLDHRLIFNGALYYDDWDRFQYSFLGPSSLTIIQNAPGANIKGAEFATDFQVTPHLNLGTNWTFTQAVLSQNFCGTDANGIVIPSCTAAQAVGNSGAPSGKQLPYTQGIKGNATARYTFEIGGWNAHVQAAGVLVGRSPNGLRTADETAFLSSKGYTTADFSIGAEKNQLAIEAFVKNAFDTLGQTLRTAPCPACELHVQGIPIDTYAFPIVPLTVGIRVSQKF